ncbi:MAG: AI-2E family transporter [Bacteroidales bacterium]|nr:AI-2E family transporter [Bacteroidales bacterium]
MNHSKKILILLAVVITVLVLIYAQSIIIPFILAILLWFIIRVIKKLLLKIKFIKRVPNWLISIFSTLVLLSFLVLIVSMVTNNIQQLSEALPIYEENINSMTEQINQTLEIDVFEYLGEYTKNINFSNILSSLFSALTGLFGNAFMILLYLLFLLLEEPTFSRKLKRMYPNPDRFSHVQNLILKIDTSITSYISIKSLSSLMTGFLSYFALLIIGVDAPLFWAFLIFILNFIPTIGSLIATAFPAIFSMLQFGEFTPAFLVLGIVGAIQVIVGNIIEPKLMGKSLNISPLVVFLTLALWGLIWGVTGMLLSVPITVILIIILSEFPDSRPLAVLLSQKGEIADDN